MKKIVYLTYNDAPSGIYAGQVTDVCRYWKEELQLDVHLVAFISIRGFAKNKAKIRALFPGATVLRMFPRAANWRLNRFLLGLVLRRIDPQVIAGRGPFATLLAMGFRKGRKVVFDSRGAYIAELQEYNVIPDDRVKSSIEAIEREAVLSSDFRLAVSQQLVKYWHDRFHYSSDRHVVIPCTLNSKSATKLPSEAELKQLREQQGYAPDDVLIVYSGSAAGWQTLHDLDEKLLPLFRTQERLRLLVLAPSLPENLRLANEFPARVKRAWVRPEEVVGLLCLCDYGWLVREDSVTNQVASPVKFAEYLAAGLPVIVSENLGDYTRFVRTFHAGKVWDDEQLSLSGTDYAEKERLNGLAFSFFVKETYRDSYLKLLS